LHPPLALLGYGGVLKRKPSGPQTVCVVHKLLTKSFEGQLRLKLLSEPSPEILQVLFVGMASLRVEWGVLQREICEALAISFVAPHPNSAVVLRTVWPQNAEMIMRAMVSLYEQDKGEIGRLVDVCQELRVLEVGFITCRLLELGFATMCKQEQQAELRTLLHTSLDRRGVSYMVPAYMGAFAKAPEQNTSSSEVYGTRHTEMHSVTLNPKPYTT